MSSNFLKAGAGITVGRLTSDPVDGENGDIYYNTSTNKFRKFQNGIWENLDITGTGAIHTQEFFLPTAVEVMVASTDNRVFAAASPGGAHAGSIINGVTIATNDLILLKNQTNSFENGVYIAQSSGAPTRYTGADTGAELFEFVAYARNGTTLPRTAWIQTLVVTIVGTDPQNWQTTIPSASFTVPADVFTLFIKACGGGGGGGGAGGTTTTFQGSGGGGGGSGAVSEMWAIPVTPGQVFTIQRGLGGAGGAAGGTGSSGAVGTDGGSTIMTTAGVTITIPGSSGGLGSVPNNPSTTGSPGAAGNANVIGYPSIEIGSGKGGNATTSVGGSNAQNGSTGLSSKFASGGAGGSTGGRAGGGGGGGGGIGPGGAGGEAQNTGSDASRLQFGHAGNRGGGGGGGGGRGGAGGGGGGAGGIGGRGGDGYVEFFWWA